MVEMRIVYQLPRDLGQSIQNFSNRGKMESRSFQNVSSQEKKIIKLLSGLIIGGSFFFRNDKLYSNPRSLYKVGPANFTALSMNGIRQKCAINVSNPHH